jgi:muramoyltetrapeptide carboxypeptidase
LSWTRPPALRRGDRIGVCAPSGPVEPERLEAGAARLRLLGFEVQVHEGVRQQTGFTAGPVASRVAQLEELFADPEIAGIWCARGGAGATQLLRRLDPARLLRHPKPFVGYSDVTALHLLLQQSGLVTFHGPMLTRDLADPAGVDEASLLHALTGSGRPWSAPAGLLRTLRQGRAEGTLLGGCLSLLASLAGTPWALQTRGRRVLLFLEDVDEPAYRLDRMLQQLRDSGALDGVVGVVLGTLPGCRAPLDGGCSVLDVVAEALADLDVPVAAGLPSGHVEAGNVTLPLGVRARLDAGARAASFEVLEPGVL